MPWDTASLRKKGEVVAACLPLSITDVRQAGTRKNIAGPVNIFAIVNLPQCDILVGQSITIRTTRREYVKYAEEEELSY